MFGSMVTATPLDRAREQDCALELSCLRLQRVSFESRQPHRRGHHASRSRGRPAAGVADERHVARLDHFNGQLVERPAAAELERLGMHVAQSDRLHLFLRPRDGALVRGRVGQPRANHGGEVVERLEHLRAVHAFGADLLDHAEVDLVLPAFAGGRSHSGAERRHGNESD
jgi:hypothetical protein